jgi:hypothetical protein
MKTKIVLALCAIFALGLIFSANAQLKANSPEDRAFSAIEAEKNQNTKLQLLLDFDKNFPNSEVAPNVYLMTMDIYKERNDTAKVDEVGEKALKNDPSNIDVLMILARNYAMGKTNVDRGVQYAQRAVDAVAKKRGTPAPPNYTDAQWKQYLDTMDQSAKGLLVYAKSMKP